MTWDDLAELRNGGQKPALPVVVTTWPKPWRSHGKDLWDAGVMVITHEPGTPMPVQLLEGLQVIFALEDCGKTAAVFRMLLAKGVKVVSAHGWCACLREFTFAPAACSETFEQLEALSAA